MSILERAVESRASSVNPLHPRDPALADLFGTGQRTVTGLHINERNALQITVFWACVDLIAQTMASLPRFLYRRLDRGKERAKDHPLYPLLHDAPNPFMSSFEFTETLEALRLTWGNAFAEIERNNRGHVTALWPLPPNKMRIQIMPNRLWYYFTPTDGPEQQLRQDQVLHIRGLGGDGIIGYSYVAKHREKLGLTQATQEYRARFYGNDASPGIALKHPQTLSDPAQERLKKKFEEAHGGLSNSHRVAVLEEGMSIEKIGVPARDAQYIEGSYLDKEDVASIFHIPPFKIGVNKTGTVSYASTEQADLDFWKSCVRHVCVRWEQRFNSSLLTPTEQKTLFVEHLADAILRADSKSRADTLHIWRQDGIINANEWRELENMNPIDGPEGEEYWKPANMSPPQDDTPPPKTPKPAAASDEEEED